MRLDRDFEREVRLVLSTGEVVGHRRVVRIEVLILDARDDLEQRTPEILSRLSRGESDDVT